MVKLEDKICTSNIHTALSVHYQILARGKDIIEEREIRQIENATLIPLDNRLIQRPAHIIIL